MSEDRNAQLLQLIQQETKLIYNHNNTYEHQLMDKLAEALMEFEGNYYFGLAGCSDVIKEYKAWKESK